MADAESAVYRQELDSARRLRDDLEARHRLLNEELRAANDELMATNEELQSANEEFQSMNEELETSKEELHASNEELTALNEELGAKNRELQALKDYAEAIVATVRAPLVVLDAELNVKSANPSFCRLIGASESDILGQPFSHLAERRWDLPELRRMLGEILPQGYVVKNFTVEFAEDKLGVRTILLNARRLGGPGRRT